MNGNNGITPTIELATTNGANGFGFPYAYPVYGNNNMVRDIIQGEETNARL